MKHLIIYLIIIVFSITCKYNEETTTIQKTDDFKTLVIYSKENTILNYSQFIDSIDYIPLETSDKALIGDNVFKIIYAKQRYFVFDETKVFVFDNNGKYLLQAGSKGHGPNEMIWPTDFFVDTIKNTIEILSVGDNKINKYNLFTGDYTGSINIGFQADNFCKTDSNKYIFYGNFINPSDKKTINNLLFYNSSYDSIINTTLALPKFRTRFKGNSSNSFIGTNNGTIFMKLLDNNFYRIDKDNNITLHPQLKC
jgi:hypothetical protein